MTIKIFTVAEMMAAEKAADAAGHSYAQMMATAGRRVAEAILERYDVAGRQALILVGPGNNGGDGLVAGRHLAEAGAAVAFYLLKPRDPTTDENLALVEEMQLEVLPADYDQRFRVLRHRLRAADFVVDALFGTGVSRPISGPAAAVLEQVAAGLAERRVQAASRPTLTAVAAPPVRDEAAPTRHDAAPVVVAVDCPSGLNCDSGALDPLAIPADHTVTFAGPKRGHFIFPGAAACGELIVADIAIDPALPAVKAVPLALATAELARDMLPARPADGHKGTFGTALIAAGSIRYWGAPALAARGAFRAGAGLVTLAVPQRLRPALAGQFPEATYPLVTDTDTLGVATANLLLGSLKSYDALLVGPGLGEAASFLGALLDGLREPAEGQKSPPLVIDADGLNLLAALPDWPGRLPPNSILTPHPGEMARLIGRNRDEERDGDRVESARRRAAEWGHVVVLKGAYTVIAAPPDSVSGDGRATLLPFANPILAVAGSGDVLAGIITGLLAQGMAPYEAAVLGGYLHGAAGQLAGDFWGRAGLLAGELADWVSHARRALE
ncbi:Bifunctional NAD(P)H-hydrate repair enzyme Nnr [Includes: ADP-dependent (S)-NAD(P)H-hydrate dehydratase; NAD(P)H-hydrate epimerase] [Candidatus Promineifilum breve]|uniref:Bifunctional NAD(P)H-hydrate repair enzyme n=1 Tax=Candidatus Promineifilum breve TaxID=1806508 RepID=A0A160SZN9_9CHLR|nr:NAD(P)H-hydrate dehydratase [Candidatus Promineifilum breve]CUS03061.2 Bifunctional NAD(P)H-hydrate repair enzyme Nnr [Includes: ADP-dependent (S)-NAD(P)H-hydrate dehydratase; NAD(P)H-hydrate epimerase] [Candidatus Promineifilum breve]